MDPSTPAEVALLAACRNNDPCDLRIEDAERRLGWSPTSDLAAKWGPERVVRAEYLRHLLVDQHLPVDLVGARIDGDLDCAGQEELQLLLGACVINGNAGFSGATFTREAWFSWVTFTESADFSKATFTTGARFGWVTFTESADFRKATFTTGASFGWATFTMGALFDEATFTGTANFGWATFTEGVTFGEATFTEGALFGEATFTEGAWFTEATFTEDAVFFNATFSGIAWFGEATFSGAARFDQATFTKGAGFDQATFTGDANFDGATFTGNAEFDRLSCRLLTAVDSRWSAEKVSTKGLVCAEADFAGTVFETPVRLDVVTGRLNLVGVQAQKRLHLVVAGATLDCTDADFAAGTLIESAPVEIPDDGWVRIPDVDDATGQRVEIATLPIHEDGRREWPDSVPRHVRETVDAREALRASLDDALPVTPELPTGRRAAVTSLRRAHIAGVTLSGVDLRECVFGSVDGLDQLVITGDDILDNRRGHPDGKHGWWPAYGRTWWRANRRVIHDEVTYRANPQEGSAREVSSTYRGLRKALEDAKDEPGAADFYYGEMEMRRRAAKAWRTVEWWLLTLYWLVSGYGLRAWRAVAALLVVVGVAALCFTRGNKPVFGWEWVRTPDGDAQTRVIDPNSNAWPVAFAAQETIALFRPAGTVGATLVGFGVVIDIVLRILGPVLLALAVLAIRNRTRR